MVQMVGGCYTACHIDNVKCENVKYETNINLLISKQASQSPQGQKRTRTFEKLSKVTKRGKAGRNIIDREVHTCMQYSARYFAPAYATHSLTCLSRIGDACLARDSPNGRRHLLITNSSAGGVYNFLRNRASYAKPQLYIPQYTSWMNPIPTFVLCRQSVLGFCIEPLSRIGIPFRYPSLLSYQHRYLTLPTTSWVRQSWREVGLGIRTGRFQVHTSKSEYVKIIKKKRSCGIRSQVGSDKRITAASSDTATEKQSVRESIRRWDIEFDCLINEV